MNVPIEFLPFHFGSLRLNTQYSGSFKTTTPLFVPFNFLRNITGGTCLYYFEKFTIFLLTKSLLLYCSKIFQVYHCQPADTSYICSYSPLTLLMFPNGMQQKKNCKGFVFLSISNQFQNRLIQT